VSAAGPLVLALSEVGPADTGRAGRKAATLGHLIRTGFPVPNGVVVPAGALAEALASAGVAGTPSAATVRALPLPSGLANALTEAYERIAGRDGPVAVRSSGVAEDLAGRSYAGQYDSVLDVRGAKAVADAVRQCWASAYADRVMQYHGETAEAPRMAVLIQPMVAADAAGVAFTANPVTGARDEILISAVPGLGDRLAAGEVTPDEWVVHRGAARQVAGPHHAIGSAAARELASVAARIADLLGGPQDIEWALVDGRIAILQSRPITALPDPAGAGTGPDGFWLRGGYSLKPLSPMNVPTVLNAVNRASAELFRYALGERIEVRSVDGWSYVRFVRPDAPDAVRAKLTGVARALAEDEPALMVRRWRDRWEPAARNRIDRIAAIDLGSASDATVIGQVVRRLAFAERMQRLHFRVGGASTIGWGRLGLLCRDLLGRDVPQVLPLLSGLPGKTTEPTLALAPLVERARALPAVADPLLTGTPSLDDLRAADSGFAGAVDDYLVAYGQRVLGADIAEPTLREHPETLIRLIADALRGGTDPARAPREAARERVRAVEEARHDLAARPNDLARFDRVLREAEDAYPLRDDTGFYGHVAWGLFRYAVLELSRRLVGGGQLDAVDDVFLLTTDEAIAALRYGEDQRWLVKQRAAEVARAQHNRGPLTLGTPPGPPVPLSEAVADLDPDDRDRLRVVQWADEAYSIGMHRAEQEGGVLRGVAASAGTYTGPARIIISEADFDKIRPGDVLVCPETTAQWSVLFSSVGALVTDTGGLLSHPAIIAREYRVPAVVATGSATRLLTDGQMVTVDGTAGMVEIAAGTTAIAADPAQEVPA